MLNPSTKATQWSNPMCILSLDTPNLLCEHYFSYHQTKLNFIPFGFFYINHDICAKLYTRKKSLNVWRSPIETFCSKLGFVWINGYDLICTLHLMILKVPCQGNFGESNHHCYTSICNNFDGLNTIASVIELLFNFSHYLACTSIGELWNLAHLLEPTFLLINLLPTCYQQLKFLFIFIMIFFTCKLVSPKCGAWW
jgi:hypothetical protein